MNTYVPAHPAIEAFDPPVTMRRYGRAGLQPCARVTCPDCGSQRWYPYGTLRQWAARETFTGLCVGCSRGKAKNAGKGRVERRVTPGGYVNLYLKAMKTDAERAIFNAM